MCLTAEIHSGVVLTHKLIVYGTIVQWFDKTL